MTQVAIFQKYKKYMSHIKIEGWLNLKQMVNMKCCHVRNYFVSLEGLPIGVIVSDYPQDDLNQSGNDDSDDTEEYFSADEDVVNLSLVKSELELTSSNTQIVDVGTQTDQNLPSAFEICHIL